MCRPSGFLREGVIAAARTKREQFLCLAFALERVKDQAMQQAQTGPRKRLMGGR